MGRLSTRLSRSAWVSASIQCRSSNTSKSGWTWLSRRSSRLIAVERLLAALRGVEPLPLGVVDRHVEEPEQRREGGFERPVQGEQLARHLLADLACVVARLDLEVGAEQVDERQKRRRLPVGDGAALDDQPALRAMRVGELPEEARLADAGLADDGHDLAVPGAGPLQRLAELLELRGRARRSG